MKLSLVIITLNAADTLEKCLKSCDFINDIVIVDSGSVDNTLEIAKNYHARVTHQDWLGFGRQKQYAVSLAKYDWVLCLDADEWLSEQLKIEIQNLYLNQETIAYQIPRCNRFMGRFLKHGEGYPDWCTRLFHRQYAQWSSDTVHETVRYNGQMQRLHSDLMHESGENIARYLEKQNNYTSLQAEILFKKGKKSSVTQLILSPFFRFIRFYILRRGFLDGTAGFVHILIGCFNSFMKYAKLSELHRTQKELSKN